MGKRNCFLAFFIMCSFILIGASGLSQVWAGYEVGYNVVAEESGEILSGALADHASDNGIGLFSLETYTDSYGDQLDENARWFYDQLVQNYVTEYSQHLENLSISFEFPKSISFEAVVEDGSFQKKGEDYELAKSRVNSAIQAASDAFSYDYPQAFWFRGGSYGYRIICNYDLSSSTGYRAVFSGFSFNPESREITTGAHKRMDAFMENVQKTVQELNSRTAGMSPRQKIKTVHDYICQKAVYRNDNTMWVHTAASLFLDENPAFVCEGYAKSMKILCYYMGINCACISGTAKGTAQGTPGAHMWNYIQMEDGKWYLVDATWDDVGANPSERYLLVGRQSVGQFITIGEERVEYTSFSTSSSGNSSPVFILPVLWEKGYGEKEEISDVTPTETPVPTSVPVATPTKVPVSTITPEPTLTATPAPTRVPVPTAMPVPTRVPVPTATPIPSEKPVPTKAPAVTKAPAPTNTPVPAADPKPTAAPVSVTLQIGQSYKPSGKIKKLSTSNKKIVLIGKNKKITGKKSGRATVTITYTNGSRKTLYVKVQKGIVKTTAISLNKRSVTLAKKGKSFKLKVVLTPVTSQQKVTYKSSNPKVATVNSKGKIVAKKRGTTVITVKSGNKKVTCKVRVKK